MRIVSTVSALPVLLATSLAACAPEGMAPRYAPAVSTAPGGGQMVPQSANSLPPGAAVNSPVLGGGTF